MPELPGHGGSSPLPAAPSLSPYADRLGVLLEHEGAAPAAVVGHSLGGAVALRLALRRPETVSALVLAAAAGISSATRSARYALTITGILKPGRKIAPHRSRVARSDLLKRLVFGRWGASDPPALPPRAGRGAPRRSGPAHGHRQRREGARARRPAARARTRPLSRARALGRTGQPAPGRRRLRLREAAAGPATGDRRLRPSLDRRTAGRVRRRDHGLSQPLTCGLLGVWRSLVARSVRVGEVPSSNLGTPIVKVP